MGTLEPSREPSGELGVAISERALEDNIARCFSQDLELAYFYVDLLCMHFCFRLASLLRATGIVADAQYLKCTTLDILREPGSAAPSQEFSSLLDEARTCCPTAAPIYDLIARCHDGAPAFLTGETPGIGVVFPRGDLRLWERVHREDAVMSIYADAVVPALAQSLEGIGPGARVLEVGGGVGAVLDRCLPLLRENKVAEFRFTDLGRLFIQRRELANPDDPMLRFSVLDLDAPLEPQGVGPQSFDIITGVNVLHSAKDLPATLRELRGALKPGGQLILGEGSPPRRGKRWRLDVVFAFLRGWWDVQLDPVFRPRPGFLFPNEWLALLDATGYKTARALPGEDWFRGDCRGGVVVGTR
jgi:SAM-dependent methyltransferase